MPALPCLARRRVRKRRSALGRGRSAPEAKLLAAVFFAMNVTNLDGSPVQDQLVYTLEGGITAVPEPASLVLFGSGLLMAARARFKKKKAAVTSAATV